jgi:hypothetical protein
MLWKMFIDMNTYIKNTESSLIYELKLQTKILVKQEQIKTKMRRKREIIKIRAEINELECKKKNAKNQQNQNLVL